MAKAKAVQFSFQRYEKKYFCTPAQYCALRERLAPYMQEDAYGKTAICNIYYDTPDWRLIRASIEKPLYKEKLRVRSYGTPSPEGPVFLELKKKFDGIVYKRRIQGTPAQAAAFLTAAGNGLSAAPEHAALPPQAGAQIGREIARFQQVYAAAPRVFIAYDRIALAGIEQPELRVTFDTRLRWRTTGLDLCRGDAGAPILPEDDRILMELKLPGVCPLWLSRILSELALYPTSFSKYGTCYRTFILPQQHFEGGLSHV